MVACIKGGSPPPLCTNSCSPGPAYSGYIACRTLKCALACAP
jgi:hypothetical protein